jgi:hypothetical protein
MTNAVALSTRKEFLLACAGAAVPPARAAGETASHKILIVVAHPEMTLPSPPPLTGWCANWAGRPNR